MPDEPPLYKDYSQRCECFFVHSLNFSHCKFGERKRSSIQQQSHKIWRPARRKRISWGGVLPYKSDRGARGKISRTPLKCTSILFYGRVPNSLPPLIATNSTTTTYATGTAKLIVIKITFEHFLLKDFLKVLS